ncbi:DUF4190 domain-containing protein [Nonomuraea glycinis]|uniref:DUF4190 domain-containing protein n=1 Tax=Nonomuraea glycinis TaxID=2047744 RepID=UPI00166C7E85|nr:DUF4190 domain-containing protein [Nonomuraea glycinis]MCA2181104.1 DUF4190 domain-containing protein [Nonomuraea glycinis]
MPAGSYGQAQEPAVPGTSPSSPYGGPPGAGPVYGAPGGGAAYPPPPGSAGPSQYPPDWRPPGQPGNGLATASLVLGVASPFLVFVCFIGLLTAILSIVFGIVAIARQTGKGRAITGIAFSVLALIIFAALALWFYSVVQECGQLPNGLAERCLEQRIPWLATG